MRILLLSDRIPPENKGGAEIVAWNLAVGLNQAGHDVHVIAATTGENFEETREGIPTYHIHSQYLERFVPWLSLYNPQVLRQLKKLYQRIQPDVVNAHNIHHDLSYHTLTMAHRRGLPTVFLSHDVMPFAYAKLTHFIEPSYCGVRSPEQYRLPRWYNLKQARFRYNPFRNERIRHVLNYHTNVRVTPSDALRQAHLANNLPEPYEVVHNCVDANRFEADEATVTAIRQRLNLEGRKVILFAGRMTREKGTIQLMQALQKVVKAVPEALLLVLSSYPIDEQITQPEFAYLKKHHIRAGGWLTGEQLAAAFHASDVITVPSIILDSFPTVNLEAMAAGKPVVATCYGGSPEAVIDGETGYIVNPFDTEDFAAKLTRLLSDDGLREMMGAAARNHVLENFPIERQVREMVAIYQRAIAENSTRKRWIN